jgi:hypothetical protein
MTVIIGRSPGVVAEWMQEDHPFRAMNRVSILSRHPVTP